MEAIQFDKLRGIRLDPESLDNLFYETVDMLLAFMGRDKWTSSNDNGLMTICSIFRFIDECSKDKSMVKFIPWCCVVGQKMAKQITNKLEYYKNEENLRLGQRPEQVG